MQDAHLFLDTNVLLHYHALDAIKWRDVIEANRIFLHITHPVLEEISVKKDMGETKRLRVKEGQGGSELTIDSMCAGLVSSRQ
jgi:hemerythrin superfamily protein